MPLSRKSPHWMVIFFLCCIPKLFVITALYEPFLQKVQPLSPFLYSTGLGLLFLMAYMSGLLTGRLPMSEVAKSMGYMTFIAAAFLNGAAWEIWYVTALISPFALWVYATQVHDLSEALLKTSFDFGARCFLLVSTVLFDFALVITFFLVF